MKTYGTLLYVKRSQQWVLRVEPHVALRAKRIFAQLAAQYADELRLADRLDTARDLEWFIQRYPLLVSTAARARLKERADAHRENEEVVHRIVLGDYPARAFELALPPRPYQVAAAELALQRKSLLLGDDLGSGKTVSAICMLSAPETRPALILAKANLVTQWKRELTKFAPQLNVHVIKSSKVYDVTGARPGERMLPGFAPDVLICSYPKLPGWKFHLREMGLKSMILDEVQEIRRGTDSKKGSAAIALARIVTHRLGLSATPIYNLGGEIWNVMQVIDPDLLGGWQEFCREWCGAVDSRGRAALKDPKAFGTYLRSSGAMLRRTRKELGTQLPPLTKVVQEVDVDDVELQKIEGHAMELAQIILSQGKQQRGAKMLAAEELSVLVRQATGIAKAKYVADFVRMLIESNDEPVLLFGWHRAVYDIWLERLKDLNPLMYTGSESIPQKEKAREAFIQGKSKLLIMSLRSGEGLDGLQKVCHTGVHGELDYSPAVHKQGTGRIDRDEQEEPTVEYYLVANGGSDPLIADLLQIKTQQVEGLRNPTHDVFEQIETDGERVRRLAELYAGSKFGLGTI